MAKKIKTKGKKQKVKVYMDRFIMGVTDPEIVVLHLNGDTLDNRRHNLLPVHKNEFEQVRAKIFAETGLLPEGLIL